MRVVLLWPTIDSVPALLRAIVPVPAAPSPSASAVAPAPVANVRPHALFRPTHKGASAHRQAVVDPDRVAMALLGLVRFGDPVGDDEDAPAPILPGVPASPSHVQNQASRWSGNTWLVAHAGNAGIAPGVVGGQLGGSQAGVRIAYALDRRHRVALAARLTTPLGAGLREAALGIEWQPTRLPVRLVAEERIALGDGSSGPALGAVGGLGPLAVGGGIRLEAYAQAGIIRRTASEPYIDGAARVAHPLAKLGAARLGAGAGVWGAAQRGAARLDVGPALTLDLPLAHQTLRVSLEYRARVAGDARPGSGVALTLGSDF